MLEGSPKYFLASKVFYRIWDKNRISHPAVQLFDFA
jgi:hypothetical protein